ncbi:aldolase/citrate lyase family protein [Candidatus Odyssella thessalonicensis]|uniref:aldolase/citrate lyase family protein n=1 Tax=Candidatus Odyssella thessalonicensis TaxID=84647 RepID=UPI0002D73484|nr:aldolase/citrate lyase family protein [Candidatus Odyssella thessalonicensis]
MNTLEKEMLSLLKNGKNDLGFTHVRAEFESEGIREDEILRLIELTFRADLDLIIKIGGCEAVTDLMKAKQLGAGVIIAPMIESSYAVCKFVQSVNRVYAEQERMDIEFLINIETIMGYEQREAIIDKVAACSLTGAVFGRVDFCGSLGIHRRDANKPEITRRIKEVGLLCQQHNLQFAVGGGIDAESVPTLREIHTTHLKRYETRKIAFDASVVSHNIAHRGLIEASRFELLWLKNKCNYYKNLSAEDQERLKMLERRVISLAA